MTSKDLTRFLQKIVVNPETGCWEWKNGATSPDGYGQFKLEGKRVQSHRASQTHFNGPIRERYEVDHRCVNPLCCCPFHLEPVTKEVNLARKQNRGDAIVLEEDNRKGLELWKELTATD